MIRTTADNETRQRAEQLVESYITAYNIVYSCNTFIEPFNGTLEELNADPHSTHIEYWIAKDGDSTNTTYTITIACIRNSVLQHSIAVQQW